MRNRRKLVGRRFEDFVRHNIFINLTFDEQVWHNFITDSRRSSLLDRRMNIRRRADCTEQFEDRIFTPVTSAFYSQIFAEKEVETD